MKMVKKIDQRPRMTLSDIPLLNAITTRMNFLTRKQRVIAMNIANADTPDYKARAVKEPDFQNLLNAKSSSSRSSSSYNLATTHPNHMEASGGTSREQGSEVRDVTDVGPNGNSVVLEEQVMEMANTQMEYGLFVNLYRKHLALMKTSIGRN